MTDLASAVLASPSPLVEDTTINTLVGFRFIDAATGHEVADGMEVTARPDGNRGPMVSGYRTTSGAIAFRGLPGMRAFEYGLPDEPGASPPEPQTFLFSIRDRMGRFVPALRRLDLPFSEAASPPDTNLMEFFLVSAPARPIPPGYAVLFTQIIDLATNEPVEHAVLEVDTGSDTHFGISDGDGNVAVVFPYPAISITLSGSPPAGETALHQQSWALTLRVRYEPGVLDTPPNADQPEIASIFAQGTGAFHENPDASPPAATATTVATLTFGRPCVARTHDDAMLYIEPSSP